ncbi:tetratricopeptide repeat protein [Kitasatospora sp. RG8]|uniref:tetratricopeptide repeat protein n=1 Tax=Kitasatospora sp. RG8 TaxID=2820815 RepID=UPI001ADFCDD8|nr:tetratricopeptide repeat protein [Kitasatospora sp. RG8]MBP0451021.1 tetratricopeptide repeat protein [Kitasatospora sp. RG8]
MTGRKVPNERLAAVIEEAGCTYQALAKAIRAVAAEAGEVLRTSPSAVHSWVAGGNPTGRTAGYIAEALTRMTKRTVTLAEIGLGSDGIGEAITPDPLATAADLGRLVMHRRRDFLALAFSTAAVGLPLAYDHEAVAAILRSARSGGRIGSDEVATVRTLTETFRSADDRLGGGHGLSTVTAYLTDTVLPMLRAAYPSEDVRKNAFGAAAELATLVGWKLHDLGREGAAQRYYLLGFQLACESDPNGHAAWMMRAQTHQALDLGRPKHCVDLAEAALTRAAGRVDRGTEALLLVTAARAYGASGRSKDAARALLAAEDALPAADGTIPTYAAASGPVASTVASHTGRTLTETKDYRAAERHYRKALEGRVPGTYQRVRGLTIANLAKSVASQRRHEEAVALWNQFLDTTDGVASHRNTKELLAVNSAMAVYSKRGIPGATELAQRAAEVAPC